MKYKFRGETFPHELRSGHVVDVHLDENGKWHRDDGLPARIDWDEKGDVVGRHWYRHGDPYRLDGPAIIYSNEGEEGESWYPPRADGPSRLVKANGIILEEEWLSKDGFHRDGAPACIWRDKDTQVVRHEHWYKDGKRHRDDGPAVIIRDKDSGKVLKKEFYREGRRCRPSAVSPDAPGHTPEI